MVLLGNTYVFVVIYLIRIGNAGNHSLIDIWDQVKDHPTWLKILEFDCGISAADRIIGGYNAALGQFPWIARLGYKQHGDEEIDWMCGGTLITNFHVLTAAHCVQTSNDDEYQLTMIRLGEHDTRTNPDCEMKVCAPQVQDRKIRQIRSHSLFNNPPFHNDVAVIVLESPVELNDYVTPICLPRGAQMVEDLKIGEMVTAVGWGKMNMSTEQRANVLQVVSLPIVKPELCDLFGKKFKVGENEICAGAQSNKDACGGDSGGPLSKVFDTEEGPKHFLVGVVSFGPTICGSKKPGVYASVAHFIKWILDNIV